MIITLRQVEALLKCFAGDDPEEELAVVSKDNFPTMEGPKGLYAYHPDYPSEGLIWIGDN